MAAVLFVVAAAAVVVGLVVGVPFGGSTGPPGDPTRLGAALAIVALAQLARLRFRLATGTINVAWGEAALIIALYLAPAGWIPAAVFLGSGLAWVILSAVSDGRPPVEVVRVTASLTIAASLATAATRLLVDPFGLSPTPTSAGAMVLGACVYLLVTVTLAAGTMAVRERTAIRPLLIATLRGKLLMFVGNVLVGLVVVTMLDRDPRWLLLLPPGLWLLQQTYSHRLRADEERRVWRTFAEATSALNKLNERGVATAGVTGALALFTAESVELDVARGDGQWRRYRGGSDGKVTDEAMTPPLGPARVRGQSRGGSTAAGSRPPRVATAAFGGDVAGFGSDVAGFGSDVARFEEPGGPGTGEEPELSRSLLVGAVHVGELRVRLPRSVYPGPRDRAALSAFADALGAALHDAATHRELRVLTARSSYEARHDPLTGLLNRVALLARGDALLRQLGHDHPVALLLLDINHFKEVNDTLGHAAGDELLQVIAARLSTLARPGELLGRLGGDEFALLVTAAPPAGSAGSTPHAVRRAREIIEVLTEVMEVADVRMSIEASVGVVAAGAGTADMTELLRRADVAMYQAKEGGGSVASYDGTRDAANTDQLALLAELREALEVDDQLVLALQPAVDLDTGAPTGVEALIRWSHPRRGMLGPVDFVRTVENSELLGGFTRYVVDKALTVAAEWGRHGLDVPISINVSARSLLDPSLPADVAESLRQHRVPPRRLVLEITETVVMSELEVIDEVLGALRALGVQLAVDDFGTGFSSLTFLARVPVDELKVDRSFVMRMADSPEAAAIVRTTVQLARELGLRVVAEGVETADQRAALAQLGCTAAQGYHFFKPMPAEKIVAVLRSLLDSAQAKVFPLRADGAS
ncbi:putative bifunctional diguanylate cyclase/phosphodiesterase [Plantactinospora sp. GCM10030261]|uniref:putative bifunctional diguanylate cyclase/phosphodiesterase n=1 Tax=Plantactinospora sp. GCM10030261 TaxID=3273420 RepID=UPI00361DC425